MKRHEAWVAFASAALSGDSNCDGAARYADDMLIHFDRRFVCEHGIVNDHRCSPCQIREIKRETGEVDGHR